MYISPLPSSGPAVDAVRRRAGRRTEGQAGEMVAPSGAERTGKPDRPLERRGGAVPYVTGDAPKGEAPPLKTFLSHRRAGLRHWPAGAYVTRPQAPPRRSIPSGKRKRGQGAIRKPQNTGG